MKLAPLIAATAFLMPLTGCNNEPEETPDITEAIPVPDEGSEVSADATEAEPSDDGNGASASAGSSTMESGSNADGGRAIDPERTKLIPAD